MSDYIPEEFIIELIKTSGFSYFVDKIYKMIIEKKEEY